MANYTATFSGDFSTYLGGKVLNAANMAKGEKNRREQEGIEQAQPGSLFAKALQSEFGGDLYNRTFGIFDPRKSFDETDRNSSKEARFTAQFPEAKEKDSSSGEKSSGSSQKVERAKQDLLRDDDKSVPVKDKDLRATISRIFGVGIDAKLVAIDAKLQRVSSDVISLQQSFFDTQKLIIDQNIVLETKFDQILEIFGKQIDFQKKLAEDAEVREKEIKLEEGKDLSTARALMSTGGGGDLSTTILGFLGRKLLKRFAKPAKNIAKGVAKRVGQRVAPKVTSSIIKSQADNAAGKALQKSNIVAKAFRSKAVQKALVRKLGKEAAEKLVVKIAAKTIPGIATVYGLGEGLARMAMGDVKGGFLSFGGAIPIAGYGFAAIDIFRDIDVNAYTKHIEPNLPAPSEENLAAFISDALGVGPNEYERGTLKEKRGLAKSGPAMFHGTEGILTPEDRRSITQFTVESLRQVGSKLVSTGVAFGDKSGNGQEVRSIFNKLGLNYAIVNIPFRSDIGRGRTATGQFKLSEMMSGVAAGIAGMFSGSDSGSSGNTGNNGNGAFTGLPQDYQKFYDHLVSKGASPNHAMGMVLNLARESSADPGAMANWNGTGLDSNGLPSGGLFQWNGPRFDAMKAYVGADWATNWKKQLDFAMVEEDISGGYRRYSQIQFATPMEAAEWWLKEWERGNDDTRDMNKMRDILSNWKSSGLMQLSGNNTSTGNFSPPTGDARITLTGGQGIDASGEPGIDFSAADYKNNYAVFPGTVVGSKHTSGYGWDVIIRSNDPNNPGKQFDALYAHFPNKESIKVKVGDTVSAGTHLGPVGWDEANNRAYPEAGNMTGWHTSLDFFPPGGPYTKDNPYVHWRQLADGIIRAGGRNVSSSLEPPNSRSLAENLRKQEEAKAAAHRARTRGGAGSPGYGKGGTGGPGLGTDKVWDPHMKKWVPKNRASGNTPMMGIGTPGKATFRNSTERRVYNALKSKSFTDAQISAIMANFDIETMGYTRMRQLENGPGRGLAQWETPGRWDMALKWYASKGKNPKNLINDIEGQIDWMIHEFTEIPADSQGRPMLPNGYRYDLNDWKNSSNDPVKLASNFMNWYEAPGTPHITQRLASAERYSKMLPRKVKQRKPNAPAGPKTIIESLKDDSGFSGFIPPAIRNMIPAGELQRRSSLMEDMEDAGGIKVQYVIINNAVAVNKPSSVNSNGSSSTTRSTSLSELHLASLGA